MKLYLKILGDDNAVISDLGNLKITKTENAYDIELTSYYSPIEIQNSQILQNYIDAETIEIFNANNDRISDLSDILLNKFSYDIDLDFIPDKAESIDNGTYSATAQEIEYATNYLTNNNTFTGENTFSGVINAFSGIFNLPEPLVSSSPGTKNYIDTYSHNSLQNLNADDYKHLTAAQLTNNAYFNVAQTWSEDQDLGLKSLILNNSSLFNLGKDLHLGGETTWIGEFAHVGDQTYYNYNVSIGNAGNDIPLFKLVPTNFKQEEQFGEQINKYVTTSNLEFNHSINIPTKSCDGGTNWNYINFLGGNNTDFWSSGLGFQSHDLAANKWSFFNHSNAAWGFGIPEGLMTSFGVDAPNWIIITAGGEVTFKKSDFPWDGGAGTDLLKIEDTGLSTEVPLDMGSNLINNVTNPTTAQGVSTKNYADTDNSIAISPMIITGGAISEGTSGTFTVAALTAWLRATNSLTGLLTKVSLAQQTNQSITSANTTYYICLNYNAGNPTITHAATNPYSTDKRNIPIGRVMKDNTGKVHYISGGFNFQDGIKKLHTRARELRNLELESGSTIAYSGTNNFTMTVGVVYGGLNKFDFNTYNSVTTDFTTVYSGFVEGNKLSGIDIAFVDGGAGEDTITRVAADFVSNGYKAGDILTVSGSTSNDGNYTILSVATDTLNVATESLVDEVAGETVTLTITKKKIDFEHYDNAGTLGNIGNNKYGVFWVYKHIDDEDVYVRYGTDSYSLAEAESTKEPTKPDHLTDFGCLIGRIIAPQAGGSFTEVDMVTDRFFAGTKVGDHAELGNLDYASAGHTGFATSAQGTLADSASHNNDYFEDHVVSGGVPADSANLTSDISAIVAYITGVRNVKDATENTYTAERDTYVDISSAGVYTFVEVANGAGAPEVTADSMRLAKVITDATEITNIVNMRPKIKIYLNEAKTSYFEIDSNNILNFYILGTKTSSFSNSGQYLRKDLQSDSGVFIRKTKSSGLTAYATGGQANATNIINEINEFTGVENPGASAKLTYTSSNAGQYISVINNHATNAMDLFPFLNQYINGSQNTAISIPAGDMAICYSYTNSYWKVKII